MPGAARPLRRLIDAARRLAQRVDLQPDGRAQSRARRFGENTDHVVTRRRGAKAAMPPEIVRELMRDAGRPRVVQRGRHLRADEIHRRDQRGIEIGIDGVGERRDEQPHAARAHLASGTWNSSDATTPPGVTALASSFIVAAGSST